MPTLEPGTDPFNYSVWPFLQLYQNWNRPYLKYGLKKTSRGNRYPGNIIFDSRGDIFGIENPSV
jgi:hypothetical protein